MTAHVEWLRAAEATVSAFAPDEEWIGAGEHRQPVLALAQDDVVAIEGTPAELRALAARITAVVSAASHLQPGSGQSPVRAPRASTALGGDGHGCHR